MAFWSVKNTIGNPLSRKKKARMFKPKEVKVGMVTFPAKTKSNGRFIPEKTLPLYRKVDPNKYSGADLRRLRAERGVGRPPAVLRKRRLSGKWIES